MTSIMKEVIFRYLKGKIPSIKGTLSLKKKEAPGGAAEDLSIMLCRNRALCGLADGLLAVD
jgi:hypothetical protein